jgi:AraC-like DNA-binding protein
MSRERQSPLVKMVAMTRPVVGYAADFPSGHSIRRHRHAAGQVIFAASGVMTVTTTAGRWVVPSERAVWVPPHVPHAIRMTGAVRMRTLYLDAKGIAATRGLPSTCAVIQVSPLLHELIVAVVGFRQPYPPQGREARLVAVLQDELASAQAAPLHLPMPRDPRLLVITECLAADPSDKRPLGAWARPAGASARTLARLFVRETGLSFAHWRQQARLLHALERLAAGESVTGVALDLGYEGPSAFIAMFRSRLGATPGRYFADGAPSIAGGASSTPDAAQATANARTRHARGQRKRADSPILRDKLTRRRD